MDENFDEGEDMEIFDDVMNDDVIELDANAFMFDPYNMSSDEEDEEESESNTESNLASEQDEHNRSAHASQTSLSILSQEQLKLVNDFSLENCFRVNSY